MTAALPPGFPEPVSPGLGAAEGWGWLVVCLRLWREPDLGARSTWWPLRCLALRAEQDSLASQNSFHARSFWKPLAHLHVASASVRALTLSLASGGTVVKQGDRASSSEASPAPCVPSVSPPAACPAGPCVLPARLTAYGDTEANPWVLAVHGPQREIERASPSPAVPRSGQARGAEERAEVCLCFSCLSPHNRLSLPQLWPRQI